MSQLLMQSNFKGAPDAAMHCWRPLSKRRIAWIRGVCFGKRSAQSIPGTSVFGNITGHACAIVLAGCITELSLLSCFRFLPSLLDPAFVTVVFVGMPEILAHDDGLRSAT